MRMAQMREGPVQRLLSTALLPLLIGCGSSAGTHSSRATPDATANEKAKIRELWERASDAVCTGNWSDYERVWAHEPDIALIHPDAREWLVGWEEIGPKYRELLNSDFRCKATTREMRIRLSPSRDMAWATVNLEFQVTGQPTFTGWQTVVFERRADGWRLVHGHASFPHVPQER